MEALIDAAHQGKEVTVVVELLARFDEEANINWAERLEQAGAQVVYGVFGLKTHAKLALLLRREKDADGTTRLQPYAHLATGTTTATCAHMTVADVAPASARRQRGFLASSLRPGCAPSPRQTTCTAVDDPANPQVAREAMRIAAGQRAARGGRIHAS
jgi:nicotinamidase-related amidase